MSHFFAPIELSFGLTPSSCVVGDKFHEVLITIADHSVFDRFGAGLTGQGNSWEVPSASRRSLPSPVAPPPEPALPTPATRLDSPWPQPLSSWASSRLQSAPATSSGRMDATRESATGALSG